MLSHPASLDVSQHTNPMMHGKEQHPTLTRNGGSILAATAFCLVLVLSFPALSGYAETASRRRNMQESNEKSEDIPTITTEVNILEWFTNALEEVVDPQELVWESGSTIPPYLQGSLVRNGPAVWDAGDTFYGHLFDGAAKLSKFDIIQQPLTAAGETRVQFSTRFVESGILDSIVDQNRLQPAIAVGPILQKSNNEPSIGGIWRIAAYLLNTLVYDNCVVNVWDYNPKVSNDGGRNRDVAALDTDPIDEHNLTTTKNAATKVPVSSSSVDRSIWAITDTVSTARVKLDSLKTAERGTPPATAFGGRGFEFLLTAHP